MAQEAAQRVEQGFKGIMVKLGKGVDRDVASLRAVRKQIGDGTPIIADPNQAYSKHEAIKLAGGIAEYAQALEGPVKKWDLDGLRAIRRLGLVELIADESLSTPASATELVKREAADMFLIKLLRTGGFHPAKKIAAIAESAGISCYSASMTNLGIGHAANLHFAASTPLDDRFGHGFESLLQIFGSIEATEELNISEVPCFKDGYYELPMKPGLGIKLINENIKRYATDRLVCHS